MFAGTTFWLDGSGWRLKGSAGNSSAHGRFFDGWQGPFASVRLRPIVDIECLAHVQSMRYLFAVAMAALISPAMAIPPYMPAQLGSRLSTFTCGNEKLVVKQSWDRSRYAGERYAIEINGSKLSKADQQIVDQEIARAGPFQANAAFCTGRGFDLAFMRYVPTQVDLHLVFQGTILDRIGLSNEATGHKLTYRTVS